MSPGSIWVMDDYAHHPTEIKAALKAFLAMGRRMILIFQPHRHSRTEHLLYELADSFAGPDELLLLPIYAAGEEPAKENLSERLALEIRKKETGNIFYLRRFRGGTSQKYRQAGRSYRNNGGW